MASDLAGWLFWQPLGLMRFWLCPDGLNDYCQTWWNRSNLGSQIAKFMGPTWGPPGSCRPQLGPMLDPWTLLSAVFKHHFENAWKEWPQSCTAWWRYPRANSRIVFTNQKGKSQYQGGVEVSQITRFMGPTWVPWAPCWPHEPCYQGYIQCFVQSSLWF